MAGWVGGLEYPILIPAKSFASLSCSSILAWLHWSVSLGAGTMWTFHARTANSSALNLLFSSASAQHKYSFKIIWSLFQMMRSFPAQSGETRCPLTQMMFWYFAHSRKPCSVGFFYQDAFLWAVLCFLSKVLACQRTRGGVAVKDEWIPNQWRPVNVFAKCQM